MWLECWLWLAPAWGSIPRTLYSRPVVHVYDPSTWWEGAEKPRSRNSWSTQLYLATWWAEASLEPAWARRDIATKTKQTAANKEQETPNNDHDKARKMPRLPRRPEKQAGPGAGASSPGFTQKVDAWLRICAATTVVSRCIFSGSIFDLPCTHASSQIRPANNSVMKIRCEYWAGEGGREAPHTAPLMVWLAPSVCPGHCHLPSSQRVDDAGGAGVGGMWVLTGDNPDLQDRPKRRRRLLVHPNYPEPK